MPCSSGPDSNASPGRDALRITVIRDPAFCFYYEENLEALRQQGAELVFVNSLEDKALPANTHALYIGGGFPEVFAAQLEGNKGFRASLREQIEAGLPVFAEGGALMYLGRNLHYSGHSYEMVGVLAVDTAMQEQRQAHGYMVLEATGALSWLEENTLWKGHAFHHFKVVNADPALLKAFSVIRGSGIEGKSDGLCYKETIATTMHIHALASPLWAEKLIERARLFADSPII